MRTITRSRECGLHIVTKDWNQIGQARFCSLKSSFTEEVSVLPDVPTRDGEKDMVGVGQNGWVGQIRGTRSRASSVLPGGAIILASKFKVYRKDTKLVLFADARTAALLRRTKLAERRASWLATAYYCIDKDAHVCCQSLREAAGAVLL